MRDVQVNLQVREEELGSARVSQSQPPEEEGERRPVRQLEPLLRQTRQPAPAPAPGPGLSGERRTAGQRSTSASAPRPLRQRVTPVKPSRPPTQPVVGGNARSRRESSEKSDGEFSAGQPSPGQSGVVRRSSRLMKPIMRSVMEEDPQSDSENNQVPSHAALGEPGEAIESVLDHRVGQPGATGASLEPQGPAPSSGL